MSRLVPYALVVACLFVGGVLVVNGMPVPQTKARLATSASVLLPNDPDRRYQIAMRNEGITFNDIKFEYGNYEYEDRLSIRGSGCVAELRKNSDKEGELFYSFYLTEKGRTHFILGKVFIDKERKTACLVRRGDVGWMDNREVYQGR